MPRPKKPSPKKISLLKLKRPKNLYTKRAHSNNNETIHPINLKIGHDRQKRFYLKDIPMQKLIALEQHHRKNTQPSTWKLSEDKTTLLLL
jgi:hypothetical protein